jgi:hypothetical protein
LATMTRPGKPSGSGVEMIPHPASPNAGAARRSRRNLAIDRSRALPRHLIETSAYPSLRTRAPEPLFEVEHFRRGAEPGPAPDALSRRTLVE